MEKKCLKIFNSKKRAISDIIVTLLLVAITVFGGIMAFALFNSAGVTQQLETEFESEDTANRSVQLIGYDTRDGKLLGGIELGSTDIENTCCDGLTSGEFIILKVRNPNFNQVTIDKVNVNDVLHILDNDGDTTLSSSTLPDAGKFKIVGTTTTTFLIPAVANGGSDITIIVTLDSDVSTIALTETIRIIIGSPNYSELEFLIPAGSTS